MKRIPKYMIRYFWDVDFKSIDVVRNKFFIIKRILENGDKKSVKWMFGKYNFSDIKYSLLNLKGYDKKTLNFWSIVFDLKVKRSYDWR